MSTTIRLRHVLVALPVVALGWIGVLAAVMWAGGKAPAALIIAPSSAFMSALPEGIAVVSRGPVSLTVRGGDNLVAQLYAAGAPLVLPAGLTGCLPQF